MKGVLCLGSNSGDQANNLKRAINMISQRFVILEKSHVYCSQAVGEKYQDHPDYLNQIIIVDTRDIKPDDAMIFFLSIEKSLGRQRREAFDVRTIDIDIIFWNESDYSSDLVTIPHPRAMNRRFVVEPLQDLEYFSQLKAKYKFNFPLEGKITLFSHS